MAFHVRYAILCDDIRKEDNGKAILIGVYSGKLILQKPGAIPLYFWVEGSGFTEDRNVRFQVRLLDEAGETKYYSHAIVEVTGEQEPVMILQAVYLIPHSGWLVLQYQQDEEWKDLLRKKIEILNQDSTELSQPSSQSPIVPPLTASQP